jgi:ABC-2 type transport system permease protein
MTAVKLALRQLKYENRAFWRNPPAAVFTIVFPLLFLIIFNMIMGSIEIQRGGRTVSVSTFYVPAIAAFSVITASFTNLGISLSFSRDQGVLKRKRGTPLPPGAFLAGRILHAVLIALMLVAAVLVFGALFYNVELPRTWPAFITTVAVGAAAFAALGVAATALVRNADAAPAVMGILAWPILFISGIFFHETPARLETVSSIFPVKPFRDAMLASADPFTSGGGFLWGDLAAVAAWGLVGFFLAVRYFSWEPRR